jgi:hypothetical protein
MHSLLILEELAFEAAAVAASATVIFKAFFPDRLPTLPDPQPAFQFSLSLRTKGDPSNNRSIFVARVFSI